MRAVLDTNVLIDGDKDEMSYANKIIDEVLAGRLDAFANKNTLMENKLIVKREMKNQEYAEKLGQYLQEVKRVVPVRLNVVEVDHEDNKILGSAVAAKADYLITSDRDLLDLEEYEGIKMVTPADFWKIYSEEELGESEWGKFVSDFLK